MREFWLRTSLPGLKKMAGIDVFSLSALFSHYRPRDILYRIVVLSVLKLFIHTRGVGGGYSQKNWVGLCSPLPKTLTLFMTKICDIPYPIYDLTKSSKPYL